MTLHEHDAMDRMITALNDRAVAECPVNFWLRDDDAALPSALLDRLLELTSTYAIPLTLAVIPESTGNALVERLSDNEHVLVAVHGWSHTNYADSHEKKQELGDHRPPSVVLAELQRGFTSLQQLHGKRFVPLLVPPWNRISSELVSHLGKLGYRGLSTFGNEPADNGMLDIVNINTHVDIIDWKGARGGRPVAELASEIETQLQENRSTIGILTHHLVHDEMAWQFLEQLFKVSSEHRGAHWLPVTDLL